MNELWARLERSSGTSSLYFRHSFLFSFSPVCVRRCCLCGPGEWSGRRGIRDLCCLFFSKVFSIHLADIWRSSCLTEPRVDILVVLFRLLISSRGILGCFYSTQACDLVAHASGAVDSASAFEESFLAAHFALHCSCVRDLFFSHCCALICMGLLAI